VMDRATGSQKRARGSSPKQRELVFAEDRHHEFEYEAKGDWFKYDNDTAAILVKAYEDYCRGGQSVVVFKIKKIEYDADFMFFKQGNENTGHERRIRLIVS
jgi:hypothetical protein